MIPCLKLQSLLVVIAELVVLMLAQAHPSCLERWTTVEEELAVAEVFEGFGTVQKPGLV